jgi:hypothetical protein
LTFDDKVPALYDKQNTIDFISPSQSWNSFQSICSNTGLKIDLLLKLLHLF